MATFVIAAVVGIVIGVLSGMLGVGGGAVMVPVFRLAFGLPPVASTGTSLFTIIPTSISGVVGHVRNKTCVVKLGILMGIGGACTSPLGVWAAQCSPGWLVMTVTALVIAYSAFTMLRKALKIRKTSNAGAGKPLQAGSAPETPEAPEAPERPEAPREQAASTGTDSPNPLAKEQAPTARIEPYHFEASAPTIAKALLIGFITGIASGYVGLGGGFIMVPLMITFYRLSMHLASGTSLIAVMILALPGTITQCALGNVDFLIGVATACGSIPGAMLGSRFMTRIPERELRLVFAAFLAVASVLLVVKETGVLG